MSADDDLVCAGFDFVIEMIEGVLLGIVAVKAGDFGIREEFAEFGFKEFGAETFVNDTGVVAVGTGRGN